MSEIQDTYAEAQNIALNLEVEFRNDREVGIIYSNLAIADAIYRLQKSLEQGSSDIFNIIRGEM